MSQRQQQEGELCRIPEEGAQESSLGQGPVGTQWAELLDGQSLRTRTEPASAWLAPRGTLLCPAAAAGLQACADTWLASQPPSSTYPAPGFRGQRAFASPKKHSKVRVTRGWCCYGGTGNAAPAPPAHLEPRTQMRYNFTEQTPFLSPVFLFCLILLLLGFFLFLKFSFQYHSFC